LPLGSNSVGVWQDTFLLLAFDEQIRMNDLERLIRPSRFRDQPMDLVVLSACETAVGDDRAAIGFAGAALKAGARSALATLWKIDDAASANLVASFYQHLGDVDLTKAQALQRAQAHLRSRARNPRPVLLGRIRHYWELVIELGRRRIRPKVVCRGFLILSLALIVSKTTDTGEKL
jgi:CHAT domain-containing protein